MDRNLNQRQKPKDKTAETNSNKIKVGTTSFPLPPYPAEVVIKITSRGWLLKAWLREPLVKKYGNLYVSMVPVVNTG